MKLPYCHGDGLLAANMERVVGEATWKVIDGQQIYPIVGRGIHQMNDSQWLFVVWAY